MAHDPPWGWPNTLPQGETWAEDFRGRAANEWEDIVIRKQLTRQTRVSPSSEKKEPGPQNDQASEGKHLNKDQKEKCQCLSDV